MKEDTGYAKQRRRCMMNQKSLGVNVLLDDRVMNVRARSADLELIGIPHRIVVSDRNLREDMKRAHENDIDSQTESSHGRADEP
jgi:prolyl-tRNA synthetase